MTICENSQTLYSRTVPRIVDGVLIALLEPEERYDGSSKTTPDRMLHARP